MCGLSGRGELGPADALGAHLADWTELLDLLDNEGPAELIRRTRQAELAETDAERAGRRGKRHDDATVVLMSHIDEH